MLLASSLHMLLLLGFCRAQLLIAHRNEKRSNSSSSRCYAAAVCAKERTACTTASIALCVSHLSSTIHHHHRGARTHARTAIFLPYLLSLPLSIHILPVSHQMTLVISSPSRSTTGFFTAIFLALRAVAVLAKLRVCAFATEDSTDTGRIDRLASRIAAPVALELTMLRAERGTGHADVSWVV